VLLEAACTVLRHLGHAAAVAVSVTAPFALASGLVGEAAFLGNLPVFSARERDSLACAEESTVSIVKAARAEGLGIMLAEPLATLCSPRMFLDAVAPPLLRVLAHGGDVVHICGDSSRLLPFLPSLGVSAFSLDRVDFAKASEAFRGGPILMGGLATDAVRLGPPDRVWCAAADVCGKVGGVFIPCSGCDLVWDTPVANVQAFIRGARAASVWRAHERQP